MYLLYFFCNFLKRDFLEKIILFVKIAFYQVEIKRKCKINHP